jgi:hypothetical protein
MRRMSILFLAFWLIATGADRASTARLAQDTPRGDAPAPAGCDYRVFHAYPECKGAGAERAWWVVTDGYYLCADGSTGIKRVREIKTEQKCDKGQPAPNVTDTVREGLAECQAPKPLGDIVVQRCIEGIWYNVYYKRYECLDGSIRADAARYFKTDRTCAPGEKTSPPPLPTDLAKDPTNLGTSVAPPSSGAAAGASGGAAPSASGSSSTGANITPPDASQSPAPAPVVLKATLVGIVVPTDTRPGDTISGTVVTNPHDYDNVPALKVVTAEVPLQHDASGHPSLEGVVVDTGDGHRQRADTGWIAMLAAGAGAGALPFIFGRDGTPTPIAERSVPIEQPGVTQPSTPVIDRPPTATTVDRPTTTGTAGHPPTSTTVGQPSTPPGADRPLTPPHTSSQPMPTDYETPPVAVDGNVQVVRGPFGGDHNQTEILVDDKPATIAAETPRATYWRVPDGIEPGPHRLTVREHQVPVASFPVSVVRLDMSADRLELLKGQSTRFRATVSGLEHLSDTAWRGGTSPDITDVKRLRELAPEFEAPAPGQPGRVLLRLENGSRDTITMSPAKKEVVVQGLDRKAFAEGPYTFTGTITSKRTGRFSVQGLVVPFLAPIKGEPVPPSSDRDR